MPHNQSVVPRKRATADGLIWLVSVLLAAAGATLWWFAPQLPHLDPQLWWPLLAALFAVTTVSAVHLPFGRDNHSLTLSQAPVVIGLFLLTTDEFVLAGLVGLGFVQLVVRRNPPIKLAFNMASVFAQLPVAIFVFVGTTKLLGASPDSFAPATWVAALAAALAADVVANVAVFVIISLRLNSWDLGELARTLGTAAIGGVVVTDLALVTVLLLRENPEALALLAVLAVLSFLLYRGYHVQRLRYSRLELLYQFTRSVDRALQNESVMETVRAEACELLRARSASVVLCQPNAVT